MRTLVTAILLTQNVVCFGSSATAALDQYFREQKAEVTEGHVSVENCGKEEFFTDLLQKESWIMTVGEIGFNGGHSSVTFLAGKPDCKVISFDIMVHPYAVVGKRFVDATYPRRHILVVGDSLKSVPAYFSSHPSTRFDLIFMVHGKNWGVRK